MPEEFVKFPISNLRIRRPLMIDIINDWLDQALQASGMQVCLSADMSESDTTIKVNTTAVVGGRWTSFQTRTQSFMVPVHVAMDATAMVPTTLAVGHTILVGKTEPMIIEQIDGPGEDGSSTLTVGRSEKVFSFDAEPDLIKAQAHSAGESIWILRYANPAQVFLKEVFMEWAKTKSLSRGKHSAFFSADIEG
jgi:hypothetical protein